MSTNKTFFSNLWFYKYDTRMNTTCKKESREVILERIEGFEPECERA